MTNFRLCFVANADSVHTRRWVDPFVERGDKVWVIHAAARPAKRLWQGIQLIDLPAMFNGPWVRYAVWTLYTRHAVRRIQPDLLHAHNIALAGWVAAAVDYRPLIVTVWGSDILLHPERSRLARGLARWVLSKADAVTAPAQHLFERTASLTGDSDKVHLIRWGVDCRVFSPEGDTAAVRASLRLNPQAPILFCPRGLSPVYDIETVIDALQLVTQAVPSAQLLLVEMNPQSQYRKELDRQIRELGLHDNVRFLPQKKSKHHMAEQYRLADLVISLPLSDSLSLTVLEAMACGTPVLVSDLPAYRGWVVKGQTGDRVPIGDATAAAKAILRLLEMGPARASLGRRCREIVCRKASLEQQIENSLELYERLVSRA